MTKQKQSPDTDTDTDTDAQRTSRRGVTTVITLTLVVGVVLAASISPLGVVAAATEFSVTTTAPETVSPDETIDITYTIENTGDTDLESLALSGTPQTSDTELTITDAASDSAATITEDNRIIFETVAPGASVTATLTVAVGTDATGTESLTANTTNGFGESEVSKQTVTELPVTTETETPTPPNFEVSDLEPQDATVNVTDAFDVSATIENTGDLQGEQEIELRLEPGGDAVRTQTVSLDAGNSTTVSFNSVTVGTAGEFTQTVASANDSVTGSLTVEEAAEDDFSVTTAAPETVSPDETIDITYTIENTGDTTLESLALSGTPQTSDTDLTIIDATSDDAATIPADNRVIFETVEPAASVTATLTVAVGTDATGTESLTAETTNGFGESEVSKQTVTELPVTTETETETPTATVQFDDQTVQNGSTIVDIASATFNGSENFNIVVHQATDDNGDGVIQSSEIGAKIAESFALAPGTHTDIVVNLTQQLAFTDDVSQLTENQTLVAMLHTTDTDDSDNDNIVHAAPITRDGTPVFDQAEITVFTEDSPASRKVSVGDATVNANDRGTVDITLNQAPEGVQTANITISLGNATVGEIEAAEGGAISGNFFQIVDSSASSITFRAADLGQNIQSGSGQVTLATITITGTNPGNVSIDPSVNALVDDQGDTITSTTDSGRLTVRPGEEDTQSVLDISAPPTPIGIDLTDTTESTVEFEVTNPGEETQQAVVDISESSLPDGLRLDSVSGADPRPVDQFAVITSEERAEVIFSDIDPGETVTATASVSPTSEATADTVSGSLQVTVEAEAEERGIVGTARANLTAPDNTGFIVGDIRRSDGSEIQNVDQLEIQLFREGVEVTAVQADPTGEYTVEVPVEGNQTEYRVEVSSPRFESFSRQLTVFAGVTERLDIRLQESSTSSTALNATRSLTSTEVTNGSTVTVTVTSNFESPTDDAKLVDTISGGGISAENLTITDAAGAAFPVITPTPSSAPSSAPAPTPTVDITWNGTLGTVSEAESFTVNYEVQIPADTPVGTTISFDGDVTNSATSETTRIDGDSSVEVVATTTPDTVTVGSQEVPTEFTSRTDNGDRTVTADDAVSAINAFIAGEISANVAVDVINAFIAS